MFDNLLKATKLDGGSDKTLNWAIEQGIVDINESNEQSVFPLESSILAWISELNGQYHNIYAPPLEKFTQVLINKSAQFPPGKAAQLLEIFIKNTTVKSQPQARQVLDVLEQQGAHLSPEIASSLLEQFIEGQYAPFHSFNQADTDIFELLKKQGAHLTADKASQLLENIIAKLARGPQEDLSQDGIAMKLMNFLQSQGGTILPAKALTMLEKQPGELPQSLKEAILKPIQQDTTPLDPSKATTLLQRAIEKKQGPTVYKLLIDKGADPNIKVKKDWGVGEIPLLNYVAKESYSSEYKELFEDLVNNPTTNINTVGEHNFTIAMKYAYDAYDISIIEALLAREDLDINTIQGNSAGVIGNTLLDIIVDNCMVQPTGHDDQKKAIVEKNASWLAFLKKMENHPNFKINASNIKKAQARYLSVLTSGNIENMQSAEQALKIIGASTRDGKVMKEILDEQMDKAIIEKRAEIASVQR